MNENEAGSRPIIKINLSVPALLALIGDDPELRLELQRGVMENFTKRHIASIESNPEIRALLSDTWKFQVDMIDTIRKNARNKIDQANVEIMKEITQLIQHEIGTTQVDKFNSRIMGISIHPAFFDTITLHIKERVRLYLEEHKQLATQAVYDHIENILQRAQAFADSKINTFFETFIAKDFERRVNEEVDRRLAVARAAR